MSKLVLNEISLLLNGGWKLWPQIKDENSDSWTSWKGPKWRSHFRTWEEWMASRKEEEGAGVLWRIDDSLYDLSHWAEKHPGGAEWIRITKGTDITEAFESHHLTDSARKILPKYFVRKVETPRNIPFTFKPDGFYSRLRVKVREEMKNIPSGPTTQSMMTMDVLGFITVALCVLTAVKSSYVFALLTAVFLTATTVCAHNFFHQKDNWRMYFFSLSGLSVRSWRVSHAMSHHLYPNSKYDLEVSMFEPFLMWLPKEDKTFINRFISWIYSPIVYALIFHMQYVPRILLNPDGLCELVTLTLPLSMVIFGGVTFWDAFVWWNVIIMMSSFLFGCVGLNAAHHHPELFHDGDDPREEDLDWGLHQLDTVRDRKELKGSTTLTLVLFGDHALHHLFPTIDHAHLPKLYPLLEETCKEFGFEFKFGSVWDLISGQFLQLARNTKISFKKKIS